MNASTMFVITVIVIAAMAFATMPMWVMPALHPEDYKEMKIEESRNYANAPGSNSFKNGGRFDATPDVWLIMIVPVALAITMAGAKWVLMPLLKSMKSSPT